MPVGTSGVCAGRLDQSPAVHLVGTQLLPTWVLLPVLGAEPPVPVLCPQGRLPGGHGGLRGHGGSSAGVQDGAADPEPVPAGVLVQECGRGEEFVVRGGEAFWKMSI